MNTSDRELLELAAKAAGYTITDWCAGRRGADWAELSDTSKWNPIEDDGDALRLAVKLRLDIKGSMTTGNIRYVRNSPYTYAILDVDSYAATRRAIVRAAAEIGKAMK